MCGQICFESAIGLTIATGDTLTYRLGAMKPETTGEETITADDLAKQVALDKVSRSFRPSAILRGCDHVSHSRLQADLWFIVRFPLRKRVPPAEETCSRWSFQSPIIALVFGFMN